MPERARRRLDTPAGPSRRFRVAVDTEAFGRLAERLARFLGTGTFLFWQTLFVVAWITLNLVGLFGRWDQYPFILLNLAFSTQAAYAAPLILLAQNRQDDRDRVSLEEDRGRASRTSAETEYLARELASLRLAVGEMVTRDYLRGELERDRAERADRSERTDRAERADRADRPDGDDRGEGGLDRATQKAITKAVDKAVHRSVSRALDQALQRHTGAGARTGPGPGTGQRNGHEQ